MAVCGRGDGGGYGSPTIESDKRFPQKASACGSNCQKHSHRARNSHLSGGVCKCVAGRLLNMVPGGYVMY